MESQIENNVTYVFWFFVWKIYPFLLWIVPFLVNRDWEFNVKGQSLILVHFNDRYISFCSWLFLFYLVAIDYQLYIPFVFLLGVMREYLNAFLDLRLANGTIYSAGIIVA